ncbi:MAG: TolC family protein [Armatimonadetes bacterium]|nr:TolC family protein [Armatimonadota bacterium]
MRHYIKIATILIGMATGLQAQTPPIQPKIQETPLPPRVEIAAPANRPADVPNRPLTADEAAAIALYHQPSISTARAAAEAAQGRVGQVRAGLLPSLNAGTSYTNTAISPSTSSGGPVGTASSSGYQVTANIRQLVFDFSHTRDLVNQAAAQHTAANANIGKVQADVVFQVKQAFYAYAQNQRLASVNEANLRNQQSHLASAQARLDAGLGLPADVVRAETAIANATFNLSLARNNASVAAVKLAQLMGIDPRTPIETADAGEPRSSGVNDLNALVDTALKQRPEMQQLQSTLQAASFGVKAAKTGDNPSIGATVGWLQRGSAFPPDKNSLTYGVSLQWTPFDAGLTKGRIKEAQANLQTQQSAYEAQIQAIVSEVSQAYLNMITAEQRIKTSDAEVANAEEGLRLTDGRYISGLGTFLDVLDAQTALLTAKTNRVNAQSAVDQARAAMARAVGKF